MKFKRDVTIKSVALKNFSAELDIEKIDTLDSITLMPNFRKYPDFKRSFEFARASLVSGTNGVGKTSLLEGIELIISGKTLRNSDAKVQSFPVKVFFT